MKHLRLLIALLFVANYSMAQIEDEENSKYESTRVFAAPDQKIYVKALNQAFRLDTLCADEVLVTHIKSGKEKNKYLSRQELKPYLIKKFYSPKEKLFKFSAETNNGFIIVISQMGKDPDIAVRFWTFFIDQISNKISVIEIEENQ